MKCTLHPEMDCTYFIKELFFCSRCINEKMADDQNLTFQNLSQTSEMITSNINKFLPQFQQVIMEFQQRNKLILDFYSNQQTLKKMKQQCIQKITDQFTRKANEIKEYSYNLHQQFKSTYQFYFEMKRIQKQLLQYDKNKITPIQILQLKKIKLENNIQSLKKKNIIWVQKWTGWKPQMPKLELYGQSFIKQYPKSGWNIEKYNPIPIILTKTESHFNITRNDNNYYLHKIDPQLKKLTICDVQKCQWKTLIMNKEIPIDGKSVQKGSFIYYVGGIENLHKSNKSLQVEFKQIGRTNIGRSQFSLICVKNLLYIVNGFQEKEIMSKSCQVFNINSYESSMICPSSFPSSNALLCLFNQDSIFRIGGYGMNNLTKVINQFIQRYQIQKNIWIMVKPELQKQVPVFFALMNGIQINQKQIFIFGGIDQFSETTKTSSIISIDDVKLIFGNHYYRLRHINQKPLPVAGIIKSKLLYKHSLYCLELPQINLLAFNGQQWSQYK